MDGSGGCKTLRMFRLLQGDVGSGKTAVAFLAMLKAAGQGSQSCMLAPTEVLTVQHLQVRGSYACCFCCLEPLIRCVRDLAHTPTRRLCLSGACADL